MTWIYRSVQWVAAALASLALLLAMVPVAAAQEPEPPMGPGDPDEGAPEDEAPDEELLGDDSIRTDAEGVAGFSVTSSAAPVTMRLYEPTIPLPVEPGQPQLEFTAGFAHTSLAAGPVSRAVSSAFWPGFGVGDGWGTFMGEFGGDPDSSYPARASAQYPSGPDEEEVAMPGGVGMAASARGLDVRAEVDYVDDLVPELVRAGTLRSVTTSTVEDGLAVANARSVVEELSLLGGLVRLDGLRVDLEASSDGVDGEESGTFAVTGLEVLGTEFVVDSEGVRVDEEEKDDDGERESPFDAPLNVRGDLDLQDLVGVRVELVDAEDEEDGDDEGAGASQTVEGLRITLDFDPLLTVARDLPLRDVLSQLPSEIQQQLLLVLGLTTKIEIGLGSASVASEATEPFDLGGGEMPGGMDAPDMAGMDDMPSVGETMGFDNASSPPPMGGGGDDFAAPETAQPPAGAQDGAAAPEVAQQLQPARSVPDLFGGLPPSLVAMMAALIGASAWGLQRLTGAALTGAVLGGSCPDAGDGVPDLRSWTAA
jgi:hypothetical protein